MVTTSTLTSSSSSSATATPPAVQLNYGQLPHDPEPNELSPWQRPADWLQLPQIAAGEQKLVGLFAVFPGEGNVLALQAAGNYCVDWGDGTSEQISSPGEVIQPHTYWFANNFYGPLERMSLANPGDSHWIQRIEGTLVAYRNGTILDPSAYRVEVNPSTNNVELVLTPPVPDGEFANLQARWDWGETVIEPIKAEHRYSYDALPASSQCSRGYRQVIVTLTPQSGSDLTLVDLSPRHSSISQDDASSPWLELRLNLPAAAGDSLVLCRRGGEGAGSHLGSVERIEILDAGGATSFQRLLHHAGSLQLFQLHKAPALQQIEEMFFHCSSLTAVELPPLPQLRGARACFNNCSSLPSVRLLELASLSSAEDLFAGCSHLREVTLTGTQALTSTRGMFRDCRSLLIALAFPTSSVVDMEAMFQGCSALQLLPPYDTAAVTTMAGAFSGCRALQTIPALNTAAVSSMQESFWGCHALLQLPALNVAAVQSFEDAFSSCGVLAAAPLQGSVRSLSFWGCALDRTALLQLFSGLAEVSEGQSLDISSNPGLAQLSEEDRAIAIAKGWTLIS
jgi:hypothetical protein